MGVDVVLVVGVEGFVAHRERKTAACGADGRMRWSADGLGLQRCCQLCVRCRV